jgi:hypothetical protein
MVYRIHSVHFLWVSFYPMMSENYSARAHSGIGGEASGRLCLSHVRDSNPTQDDRGGKGEDKRVRYSVA